jgi:putative hemolysin
MNSTSIYEIAIILALILARLQLIPHVGTIARVGNFETEVVDLDGRRIDKVLIRRCWGNHDK